MNAETRLYYREETGEVETLSTFRNIMTGSIRYKQIAYLNLSDSSSLVEIEDLAGIRRFAIGYQGDDTLYLLTDEDAEEEMEQTGGEGWHRYDESERAFVQVDGGIPSTEFDEWAREHLIPIEDVADEYDVDAIIRAFYQDDETGLLWNDDDIYLVVETDSENTPDFPYIPDRIWKEIEEYDGLFEDICNGQPQHLATALVQLKLLRGHPIPEIGYMGHGFIGYDGRIMRVE